MSKRSALLKNFFIILFGKIFTQLVSFLLLPLYTTYISTNEFGTIDLITTYLFLLAPVITLQLEMAAFRFLVDVRKNENEKSKIITNILYTTFISGLCFIILLAIIMHLLNIQYNFLIIVNIIFIIFANLFLQIARGLGYTKEYSIANCISGIAIATVNIILIIYLKMGAKGILVSMMCANFLSSMFLFFKLRLYQYIIPSQKDKTTIKKLMNYSFPLIPNNISWWIINASDRTIISWILGTSANGIYAVSNKFASLIAGIFGIFGIAWTETASIHINDEDRDIFFSDVINKTLLICSSICLLIISFMPFIFHLLVNDSYSYAYLYIPILLISMLFNVVVSLYSAIYVAKKMTKHVRNTSIFAAIINIVVNLTLIKYMGLFAACLSTLIAYLSMALYRHIDLKKYIKIALNTKLFSQLLIIYVIVMLLYYLNNNVLNIISLIISIVASSYLNKNNIIQLLKILRKKLTFNS